MKASKADMNDDAKALGRVAFVDGRGDMPMIEVTTPWSSAEIYPHGAHVTHFKKKDEPPLLFLSQCGRFADDRKWKSLPDIRPVQEVYQVLVDDAIGFRTVGNRGCMVNVRVIDPDPDGSKFAALTSEG